MQEKRNATGKAVKGSQILVLGVADKKDVSDISESPALDIIHLLEAKGAKVSYLDPHVSAFPHEGMDVTPKIGTRPNKPFTLVAEYNLCAIPMVYYPEITVA